MLALLNVLEGNLDQSGSAHAHGQSAAIFVQKVDGMCAQLGGQQAVARRGAAAALDVAQHGGARLVARELFDNHGHLRAGGDAIVVDDVLQFLMLLTELAQIGGQGAERALGKDEDHAALAAQNAPLHALGDFLDVPWKLGNHADFRAAGQRCVQRDVAAVAAHDGQHAGALVGIAGLANLVQAFAGSVQRRVEADGVIGVGQIVVDGSRHADGGKAQPGKRLRALVGAVAADADQSLDAQIVQIAHGQLLNLQIVEVHAARGAQEGAAAVDFVRDAARGQNFKIVVLVRAAHEHAVVAALEAHHRHVVMQRCANHRADGRVHARSISAGGQNTNSLHTNISSFAPQARSRFVEGFAKDWQKSKPVGIIHYSPNGGASQ